MLSTSKLNKLCSEQKMSTDQLAGHVARAGFERGEVITALRNWKKGLYKPAPTAEDIERIANALGVRKTDVSQWRASYRYAPSSASKARLVTELINGRRVQDALDVLKFEHRRAAKMIEKILKSAIANADENEADIENLYICEARADGAGRRIGTKSWIAKDRGRAHPIRKEASHIHVTVTEE